MNLILDQSNKTDLKDYIYVHTYLQTSGSRRQSHSQDQSSGDPVMAEVRLHLPTKGKLRTRFRIDNVKP